MLEVKHIMKLKGYMQGYYDMFHVGHLNVIKRAAKLCDELTVGVMIDEECLRNKGHLPTIPFKDRIEIIKNIKGVHDAVPVYEDDILKDWDPGDFKIVFICEVHRTKPGWEETAKRLSKEGVTIIYMPYTYGISSSGIRDRIKNEKFNSVDKVSNG